MCVRPKLLILPVDVLLLIIESAVNCVHVRMTFVKRISNLTGGVVGDKFLRLCLEERGKEALRMNSDRQGNRKQIVWCLMMGSIRLGGILVGII